MKDITMTKAEKYISWGNMSEKEKAEFFKSNPFKIKKHEMKKLSDSLKEYFENTPQEQLDKDWEEIKHLNEVGEDAVTYCERIREQKDKELILKDLSARLPYKVKCNVYKRIGTLVGLNDYGAEIDYGNGEDTTCEIQHCYLYLRPMTSMTKEELYEVQKILGKGVEIQDDFISIVDSSINSFTYLELQAVFDWLNAHHFDYRGLIEKGLAFEAPKDMYVANRIIAKNKELIFKGNSNERYNFDNRRKNTQAYV